MMTINILCFNKLSIHYKVIFNYFYQKVSQRTKIVITEYKELNNKTTNKNKVANTTIIINKLSKHPAACNILLDIKGKPWSTETLAATIVDNQTHAQKNINFIIGPSDGFNLALIKPYCQHVVNFGLITLPYELIRVVLMEQIYRCFKIMNNEKYHK